MKKVIYLIALVVVLLSCKKDEPAPTPPPAGPCNCGEILQGNVTNSTLTVKNYCSGNILTFQVGGSWYANPQADYCQSVAW